jgi:fused signal recognition particle receptor
MFALLTEWFTGQPGWTLLAALIVPPCIALLLFGRRPRVPEEPPPSAVDASSDEAEASPAEVGRFAAAPEYQAQRLPVLDEASELPFDDAAIEAPPSAPAPSLASRLARTSEALVGRLGSLIGARTVDTEVLEDLEALLFGADLGVSTADALLEALRERAAGKGAAEVRSVLREEIEARVARVESPVQGLAVDGSPHVILVLGVNGSGKTTTIGKLAARYARAGKRVVLGAGDTFRAAAVEQLEVWADRVGCELVKGQAGGDPAAVAFDTVKAATARGAEVAIVDTAGRLQTKDPLIEELRKISRVIGRGCEGAPHETLLVLDANTGQNAISQARVFTEAVGVTGIVLTKLDGTAKGGVLVGLADEFGIPVRFVGVGEGIEDLRDFEATEFVDALFKK